MLSDKSMLASLSGLIAIPSVSGVEVSADAPYGSAVRDALHYTLDLCERLGFKTVNKNGHLAWAEIGNGDRLIAVVPHLDVVPAGEGWTLDPFALTESNGRLYGRGSSDNKGPAIASIYAAADVASQLPALPVRIRIILGQCEEVGDWKDMEQYRREEEKPFAGFTPDASFPALCGEQGQLWGEFSIPLEKSGLLELTGGNATNMVPASCRAVFVDRSGKKQILTTSGKASHATKPEDGINAIGLMMDELSAAGVSSPLIDFYQKCMCGKNHGEGLGCDVSDPQSGRTTACIGTARTEKDSVILTLDMRYPVSGNADQLRASVMAYAADYGLAFSVKKENPPYYRDPDSPLMRSLLAAYLEETGDGSAPIVIGGGTYARAIDNIIGFGSNFLGKPHTEHQANEYIEKEDFFLLRRIFRNALFRLIKMSSSL